VWDRRRSCVIYPKTDRKKEMSCEGGGRRACKKLLGESMWNDAEKTFWDWAAVAVTTVAVKGGNIVEPGRGGTKKRKKQQNKNFRLP